MRLQSRCWSELRSSDGLTGARGSASRWLIHMAVSRMLSLVPCLLLAGRLNSSPYGLLCKVAWVSLWLKELVIQERARRRSQCLLQYSLKSRASSVTPAYSWEAILLVLGSTFCMEWTFLEEKYWMRDKEDEETYERPISLENLLTYFKTTVSEDPFLSSCACPCPLYHIVPQKDTI